MKIAVGNDFSILININKLILKQYGIKYSFFFLIQRNLLKFLL